MGKQGEIEIHITGYKGNEALTPYNYDIKELQIILSSIEDLLYPGNKKNRPSIAYHVEDGSVRNIFITSLQAVVMFNATLQLVNENNSIDGLELNSAKAFENIQIASKKTSYTFEFSTSEIKSSTLRISPETNFVRTSDLWVDAEFYFYGVLTNAGGKDKSNIHLDTKDEGTLIIDADKTFLKEAEKNLLYKDYGVRVKGKQNVETGEIDTSNLKMIELINYSSKFDESYLESLISKVGDKFKGIDADNWVSEIRGKS